PARQIGAQDLLASDAAVVRVLRIPGSHHRIVNCDRDQSCASRNNDVVGGPPHSLAESDLLPAIDRRAGIPKGFALARLSQIRGYFLRRRAVNISWNTRAWIDETIDKLGTLCSTVTDTTARHDCCILDAGT